MRVIEIRPPRHNELGLATYIAAPKWSAEGGKVVPLEDVEKMLQKLERRNQLIKDIFNMAAGNNVDIIRPTIRIHQERWKEIEKEPKS